jgi:chromosome segregation ATPase
VYKRFSSEVDKLLGVNSMLERDAVYMKEIVKAKNERIEDLNRECEGLRSEMFSYQSRELDYKKREEEYKKREEEYKEEISRMMDQLSLAQQETKQCQDVLCQIAFLSPDERGRLANILKKTRQNLEPFLSQEE